MKTRTQLSVATLMSALLTAAVVGGQEPQPSPVPLAPVPPRY